MIDSEDACMYALDIRTTSHVLTLSYILSSTLSLTFASDNASPISCQ